MGFSYYVAVGNLYVCIPEVKENIPYSYTL